MTGDAQKLGLLARLVLAALILLIIGGIAWHGITVANHPAHLHDLIDRPSGPMAFRFILQPLMAAIEAILHGRRDARTGRTPYFWTVMSNRRERLAGCGKAERDRTGSFLGIVMDVIYQIIVLQGFYPADSVIVALAVGICSIPRASRYRRASCCWAGAATILRRQV